MLSGGITYVHQLLEKKGVKPNLSALPNGIVSLEGFSLPWYVMLVYGTLIFLAISEFGSLVVISIDHIVYLNYSTLMWSGAMISWAALVFGSYLIGTWIGRRCDKFGIRTTISTVFLGLLLKGFVVVMLLGVPGWMDAAVKLSEVTFGVSSVVSQMWFFLTVIWVFFGLQGLIYSIIGTIGFLQGRRRRLSVYLGYLLSKLSPDAQNAIVSLAYEEAQKESKASVRNATLQSTE